MLTELEETFEGDDLNSPFILPWNGTKKVDDPGSG